MKYKKEWKERIGIYFIKNKVNNKIYIGKSKNIYNRLKSHTTALNRELSKHENQYIINSWKKYGEENFEMGVIEYCKYEELSRIELNWILYYKSNNSKYGYNLRIDTEKGMIPSDETRLKMSISQKLRNKNMSLEEKEKLALKSSQKWKNYSEGKLNEVKDNLSESRTIYKWYQYDKYNNLIKEWNSVREILKNNPDYKRHNIYAVASGEKPSIYGYIWKKVLM